MNKFSVALLSSLATIGVGTGVVLVAGQFPSVKGKLNIAFGESNKIESDKVIGNEDISNLPLADAQFKQELYKRGYVIVNYARVGTSNYEICPINSVVDYQNHPTKEGSYFVGWSTTEDGLNPVLSVEESTTLYPIFKEAYEGDVTIFTHTGDGYIWSIENAMNSLWVNQQSIFDNGTEYKVNIIGWSISPDSVELVTELQAGGSYYAVYNIQPVDKVMSCVEANIVTTKLIYGENAFNTIQFEGVEYSCQMLMRDYCIDEVPSINILDKTYDCIGIANSIDSVETLSIRNCGAGDVYYGVYHCIETGEILSTQYLMDYKQYVDNKEPVRIVLNAGYQAENIKVFTGNEVDDWFNESCHSIYYNGKFYHPIGISDGEYSFDLVDSYIDGDLYFIVYQTDDGDLMTSAEYSNDVRMICGDVVFQASYQYASQMTTYSIGNDVFEVVGCSLSSSSTEVLSYEELENLRFSGTDVYVVFNIDDRLYSYSTFMSEIYSKPYFTSVNWYNGVSTNTRMIEQYETHISTNNGQSYYRFAGWTNNADSKEILNDLSQCSEIFAVYENPSVTTNNRYSYNELRSLIKYGNPQPVDEIPEKVSIMFHTYKNVNGELTMRGSTGYGKASMTLTEMNKLLVELPNFTFAGWAESTWAEAGAMDYINRINLQSGGLMTSTDKTYIAVYSFYDLDGVVKYLCALDNSTNRSILADISSRTKDVVVTFNYINSDGIVGIHTDTGLYSFDVTKEYINNNKLINNGSSLYFEGWTEHSFEGTLDFFDDYIDVDSGKTYDEGTILTSVYSYSDYSGIRYVCAVESSQEIIDLALSYPKEYNVMSFDFEYPELVLVHIGEPFDEAVFSVVDEYFYYNDEVYTFVGLATDGKSTDVIAEENLNEGTIYYPVYSDPNGNLKSFDESMVMVDKYINVLDYDYSLIKMPSYYCTDFALYRELYCSEPIEILGELYYREGFAIESSSNVPEYYIDSEVVGDSNVFFVYSGLELHSADEMLQIYKETIVSCELNYFTEGKSTGISSTAGSSGEDLILNNDFIDTLNILNDDVVRFVGWSRVLETGSLTSVDYMAKDDEIILTEDCSLYAVYSYTYGGETLYLMGCYENLELLQGLYNRVYVNYNVYDVNNGLQTISLEEDVSLKTYLSKQLNVLPANTGSYTYTFRGLTNSPISTTALSEDSIIADGTYYPVYRVSNGFSASYDEVIVKCTSAFVNCTTGKSGSMQLPKYYFINNDIDNLVANYDFDIVVKEETYSFAGIGQVTEFADYSTITDKGYYNIIYTDSQGNIYSWSQVVEIYRTITLDYAIYYFTADLKTRSTSSTKGENATLTVDSKFLTTHSNVVELNNLTFVGWTQDTRSGKLESVEYSDYSEAVVFTDDVFMRAVYSFVDEDDVTKYLIAHSDNERLLDTIVNPELFTLSYVYTIDGLQAVKVKEGEYAHFCYGRYLPDRFEFNGEMYYATRYNTSGNTTKGLNPSEVITGDTHFTLYSKTEGSIYYISYDSLYAMVHPEDCISVNINGETKLIPMYYVTNYEDIGRFMECYNITSMTINNVVYEGVGLSNSADSVEVVNNGDIIAGSTYYAIFKNSSTGEIISYNDFVLIANE